VSVGRIFSSHRQQKKTQTTTVKIFMGVRIIVALEKTLISPIVKDG
jgi:hypothetical protein